MIRFFVCESDPRGFLVFCYHTAHFLYPAPFHHPTLLKVTGGRYLIVKEMKVEACEVTARL